MKSRLAATIGCALAVGGCGGSVATTGTQVPRSRRGTDKGEPASIDPSRLNGRRLPGTDCSFAQVTRLGGRNGEDISLNCPDNIVGGGVQVLLRSAAIPNAAEAPSGCGGGPGSHICERVIGRIILNATGRSAAIARTRLAMLEAFVLVQPHVDLAPEGSSAAGRGTQTARGASPGAAPGTSSPAPISNASSDNDSSPSVVAGGSSSSINVPTIGGCFVLPDGTADAEVTFRATTPLLQVFVLFTDVSAGQSLTSGDADNEDGRYDAAPGGPVINQGDRITCQIQKVVALNNGGSQVSGTGTVVSQGQVPANYGVGNGNIPW